MVAICWHKLFLILKKTTRQTFMRFFAKWSWLWWEALCIQTWCFMYKTELVHHDLIDSVIQPFCKLLLSRFYYVARDSFALLAKVYSIIFQSERTSGTNLCWNFHFLSPAISYSPISDCLCGVYILHIEEPRLSDETAFYLFYFEDEFLC